MAFRDAKPNGAWHINSKRYSERIIYIKDWGLENPVYSNDSFQGLQMNRRVDVVLHPVVF